MMLSVFQKASITQTSWNPGQMEEIGPQQARLSRSREPDDRVPASGAALLWNVLLGRALLSR